MTLSMSFTCLYCYFSSRKIIENVGDASEVVEVHVDNVAGVKLPVFKSKHRDVASGTICYCHR